MKLAIDVQHSIGQMALETKLTLEAGFTALVGPSGAGKTTLLNIIAGVIRPSNGSIRFNEEVWLDTSDGIVEPAHHRQVGYVFQEPRLFPHLNVRRNLTYGRWLTRRRGNAVAFDDAVALLGLGDLLDRRPTRLSGGEAQRVALGRALLSRPRLLLLDEPLASVDVSRRNEVLPYLDRLRSEYGIPMIYVTHTISEVQARADRIVVLEGGKVVGLG